MIDTVKIIIPFGDEKKKFNKLFNKKHFENEGWIKIFRNNDTGEEVTDLEYIKANMPSYHSYLIIVNLGWGMQVEVSIPKLVYFTNALMVYDFTSAFIYLRETIQKVFEGDDVEIAKIDEWRIERLDICWNWKFESEKVVQNFLDEMKRLEFPYKKKQLYETGILFKTQSCPVEFYLKHEEFKKAKSKKGKTNLKTIEEREKEGILRQGYAQRVFEFSKGILRFEVKLRKKELLTRLKDKICCSALTLHLKHTKDEMNSKSDMYLSSEHSQYILLKDINQDVVFNLLNHYFNKFMPVKPKVKGYTQMNYLLEKYLSGRRRGEQTARRVKMFHNLLLIHGRKYIRKNFYTNDAGKHAFYRDLSILKEICISELDLIVPDFHFSFNPESKYTSNNICGSMENEVISRNVEPYVPYGCIKGSPDNNSILVEDLLNKDFETKKQKEIDLLKTQK